MCGGAPSRSLFIREYYVVVIINCNRYYYLLLFEYSPTQLQSTPVQSTSTSISTFTSGTPYVYLLACYIVYIRTYVHTLHCALYIVLQHTPTTTNNHYPPTHHPPPPTIYTSKNHRWSTTNPEDPVSTAGAVISSAPYRTAADPRAACGVRNTAWSVSRTGRPASPTNCSRSPPKTGEIWCPC